MLNIIIDATIQLLPLCIYIYLHGEEEGDQKNDLNSYSLYIGKLYD